MTIEQQRFGGASRSAGMTERREFPQILVLVVALIS